MSLSLLLIGLTSLTYHATLCQAAQYLDELSMFTLAGWILQRLYTAGRSKRARLFITTVIVASVAGLSAYYVHSGVILFHMSAFAGLLTLIWPRTLYLLYSRPRTTIQQSRMAKQFMRAAATLLAAFAIWNVDLEKCLELRGYRYRIGLPWAWLLELHGWWHILTAVGASDYMDLVHELCDG